MQGLYGENGAIVDKIWLRFTQMIHLKPSIVLALFCMFVFATLCSANGSSATTITVSNDNIDIIKSIKIGVLVIEAVGIGFSCYTFESSSPAWLSVGFAVIFMAFVGSMSMNLMGYALFIESMIYQIPILGYLLLIYHYYERVLASSQNVSFHVLQKPAPVIPIVAMPTSSASEVGAFTKTKVGIAMSTILAMVLVIV